MARRPGSSWSAPSSPSCEQSKTCKRRESDVPHNRDYHMQADQHAGFKEREALRSPHGPGDQHLGPRREASDAACMLGPAGSDDGLNAWMRCLFLHQTGSAGANRAILLRFSLIAAKSASWCLSDMAGNGRWVGNLGTPASSKSGRCSRNCGPHDETASLLCH